MNRIAGRAWVVILLCVLLIGGMTFFLCEYAANAEKWVVFPGSPHVYNGTNINCGIVTDREDYILLDMSEGRQYSADPSIRAATIHWLGDRDGSIYAPALSHYSAQIAGFDFLNGVYNYADASAVTRMTLSATAQSAALTALGNRKGTVAVYNYKTGELLCAVTTPTYDPDKLPDIANDTSGSYEGVYVNRFTQSTYTPGSIFKIVTLAAALESIPDITEQTFSCAGSYEIDGEKITCEAYHGDQDLQRAFCNSCNCAFAQIALQIGAEKMGWYVEQFGLTDSITFDGITTAGGSYEASDTEKVGLAWSAVGQHNDQINPAVFLSFIGAIANDGRGVAPYLIDRISVSDNSTYSAKTHIGKRIMSATTAKLIREYMGYNIQENYGVENFPGLTVGAKTGTAEVEGKRPNAMFAGLCMDPQYPLAFIVCVEDAGYGRTVCIPVASTVLEACKTALDNPG